MKKWIKIVIFLIGTPVVIVLLGISFYLITNIQGTIDPYQVGNPESKYKILIASQGSEFKDKLLLKLIDHLRNDSVFLSITDCTLLEQEKVIDWDAIVIIHTTQIHGMPKSAKAYLGKVPDLSKVVLVTTSGGGDEEVSEFDVDAITTASRLILTDTIANLTVLKVHNIMNFGNE